MLILLNSIVTTPHTGDGLYCTCKYNLCHGCACISHTREKPLKCNRCDYTSLCKSKFYNLKHLMVHTGETLACGCRCNLATKLYVLRMLIRMISYLVKNTISSQFFF